tara:strand:- start:687 stop:3299 length:2613 start_codon:yes stop_codon:yes gene_type:complete
MLLRAIKKIFLTLFIITLLIVGFLFSISRLYEKEINKLALEQLNKQLVQPIAVDNIELSAFSHFPSISLEFSNLRIQDPFFPNDTLIFAKKAYLNFDTYDLLNKKYIVRKLILSKGFSKILINNKGLENYMILKKNEDEKKSKFEFLLDQVVIENFSINYQNKVLKQDYDFSIKKSKFKGAFSDQDYDLNIIASMNINHFKLESINYIKSKSSELEMNLHVNNDPFSLTIKNGKLKLGEMNFLVEGNYQSSNKDIIDLTLKGNQIQISEIFSVLPVDYSRFLENYSSKGILNFDGSLVGELNTSKSLDFSVLFNAKNAIIKDIANNLELDGINLNGQFNNRQQELIINQFSALLEGKKIGGSVVVSNFSSPKYTLNLVGDVDMSKVPVFLNFQDLTFQGESHFEVFSKLITQEDNVTFEKLSGKVNSELLTIDYPSKDIHLDIYDFDLDFPNENINLKFEKSAYNQDTFSLNLKWKNWDKFLFSKSKKIDLYFDAEFDNFRLDQLLETFSSENSSDSSYEYNFSGNIKADNLLYDNLKFRNVLAKKITINNILKIKSLKMKAFDGDIQLMLLNPNLNSKSQKWVIESKIDNLNIQKVMMAFKDFDQDLLKSENINGEITSEFSANILLDSLNNFDVESSTIESKNIWKNITLLDYPFLDEILKYFQKSIITRNIIDIDYYNNKINEVSFENFNTDISLSDEKVNFSKTKLKNNLLNFTFYGSYNVNTMVDYHLNFNWSDLVKKNKSTSQIVQENKTVGKQLFLKITGPSSDLEYSFDKEEIKNERKEKIKTEKEIIKSIIKGEPVPEEKKDPEIFEFEWEEEVDTTKAVEKVIKPKKKSKKKDSSKINKFLKKLGVEEEVKEKPKFEIDQ